MTVPTRQQPNKVLSVRIESKTDLDSWAYEDFPGDPYWQGGSNPKPYRWILEITVNSQVHGDPSTREPFRYNGLDINVGDWVADVDRGRALKIVQTDEQLDNIVFVVVEDIDRYNIFLDENGNGIFPVPFDGVVFSINDMMLPILNPLPSSFTDVTFLQEIMGRFQNNNPLYRTRVFQDNTALSDNDAIWVDPADGLFKTVQNNDELKRMAGTVDRVGPGEDVFYFIPATKVIEGINPPLPGNAGDLIYSDPSTGELTSNPIDQEKVSYIQLTDARPDTTTSNADTVVQSSTLGVNNVAITFSGTTLVSVVNDVNLRTSEHNVVATLNPTINRISSESSNLAYGVVAMLGLTTTATINGVLVSFNDGTNGTAEFGSVAVNAVDMANVINAASIPDITATGFSSTVLNIFHNTGGAIAIVNGINDTSGTPFAGLSSGSGVNLSNSAGGTASITFTNADGSGIIFKNVVGQPVFDLMLVSVRNGELPLGLVVEQFVTLSGGVNSLTVYATIDDLPGAGDLADQAYVIDSADINGNNADEWSMYLWDGFSWVKTANLDESETDARTLTQPVFFNSTSVEIGTLSNGRRVSQIVVEVTTAFDGTPTLDVGDTSSTGRLMNSSYIDLNVATAYSVTTDFVYNTGNDTTILATLSPGGSTVGTAVVMVTYI